MCLPVGVPSWVTPERGLPWVNGSDEPGYMRAYQRYSESRTTSRVTSGLLDAAMKVGQERGERREVSLVGTSD